MQVKNFRPEIQALRALAVLLVVAYHLEPNVVPGGYIGVDIFFVISGFLITSHLLREAERSGRVKLSAFFAGRARRILPAAMLVILVVVAAGVMILPKTQWGTLGTQALASAFSVQNWVLAADSVDYLAAEQAGPPQHFWSLGVEEQFYLFWPLLILAVCWLVKPNLPGSHSDQFATRRRWLWMVFGTVALLSLGYSVYAGYSGDSRRVLRDHHPHLGVGHWRVAGIGCASTCQRCPSSATMGHRLVHTESGGTTIADGHRYRRL